MPTSTALFALTAWLPLVVLLFALIPQRRAVLAAFVLGWLFLPQASIPVPGALPDYGRSSAIGGGVLAAILLLDIKRFETLRPTWLDLPILLLCFSQLFASLSNGLGLYDGLGQTLNSMIRWGLPYLIGRLYFSDAAGLKLLAGAIVIGGLIYVPLCLYESRLSPVLHSKVYGFAQHSFQQTRRWGGWRPMVFLSHGLEVGKFMASASLLACWMWLSGATRRYEGLSLLLGGLLIVTTILCRSTGAILLLGVGGVTLLASTQLKRRLPLLILALLPLTYASVRATGLWSGKEAVDLAALVSAERSRSLQFRLSNEDILIERAQVRIVFGWGSWGRNRVRNERGEDISITDGRWVITLGKFGLVGLLALLLAFLLPILAFVRLVPPDLWASPNLAAGAGLACLLAIEMIDNLMNAHFTPFAPLAMGALVAFCTRLQSLKRQVALSAAVPGVAAAAPAAPRTGGPRPGTDATGASAP